LLQDVKITAQKIVKGSQNLNGPGIADLVLDEKDMVEAAKKSWLQIFKDESTPTTPIKIINSIGLYV
jgi:hypothetical protein